MDFNLRRQSKTIKIGNLIIGGNYPIAIQSMCNTHTLNDTIKQIHMLMESGCDIVRIAIPDIETANWIPMIKNSTKIPLVADIHFDYKLAIESIKKGADKIRINPGNIGDSKKITEVIKAANDYDIPIRIGINGGSLKTEYENRYGGPTAEALSENMLDYIKLFEDNNFFNTVLSVKSSNISTNIYANFIIGEKTDYPIHIGITEAGPLFESSIRSSIGLGYLLLNGIGDTLRVSITGNVLEEINIAKEILKNVSSKYKGIRIISCPTCSRTQINIEKLVGEIKEMIKDIVVDIPITIAIMGCIVNGPGEAKHADIGIAMDKEDGIIFKNGKILKRVNYSNLKTTFLDEFNLLLTGEKNGTSSRNTERITG